MKNKSKFTDYEYVLYHAGCDDGFGGAWAARKAIGEDVQYIPVQYGAPPPDILRGAHILMVDFSYDRETIQGMREDAGQFLILDHHKTAEAELDGLPYAIFDMDRSGAMMAWNYFHDCDPPALIQYVQDRDLWHKELEGSEAYTAALRSYRQDFDVWDILAKRSAEDLVDEGGAILRAVQVQVERQCENSQLELISGYRVPTVNTPCYISEVCEELLNRSSGAKFSATYFVRRDGKRVYSLRSRGEFDVSAVARGNGGGGHKNAAGFVQ